MRSKEIRLSQQEKDQLSRLKGKTGLEHWNELCRWAVNVSLTEPTKPPNMEIVGDSNTTIPWHVFAGDHSDLYLDLVKIRCLQDGLETDDETAMKQFRLHLKRGIGYLAANKGIKNVADLIAFAGSHSDEKGHHF